MTSCHHCGGDIIIRHVDGVLKPIHLDGRWCSGAAAVTVRSFYRESLESECRKTACSQCGEDVYFIRYNGGSVWVDPPLGPPWPKHECFIKTPVGTVSAKPSLIATLAEYRIDVSNTVTMGVVQAAESTFAGKSTVLVLEYNDRRKKKLYVAGSATHLAGKIVVLNLSRRILSARGLPDFEFAIVATLPASSKTNYAAQLCRECDVPVRPTELEHHLFAIHGIKLAKS